MKKRDIVKTHEEFNNIIKKGKSVNNDFFAIYYLPNNINHTRYGISVGTKLGNAVFRNRYKRRIRMIIHENNELYNKCYDYIILLRKRGVGKNYQELSTSLVKLIHKLKEL